MHAKFHYAGPNLLLEARPGELFFPLGPDLVECLCTVRSAEITTPKGEHIALDGATSHPDAQLAIVVLACRVAEGEPGFYPAGFCTHLVAATPIVFVDQVKPIELVARGERLTSTHDWLLTAAAVSLSQFRRPAYAVRG